MALQKTTAYKGISANYWVPSAITHNAFGMMGQVTQTTVTYSLFVSKTFYDTLAESSRSANVLDTKTASIATFGESLADLEAAIILDASSGNYFYNATIVE